MKRVLGALATISALAVGSPRGAWSTITPAEVAHLALKWDANLASSVSGGPVLANGLLYVVPGNGTVYALDPHTGEQRWSVVNPGRGVQGSVLAASGGRICVGDALSGVTCYDGLDGDILWRTSVGRPDRDHIWSAPAEANGRLFVGVASHTDNPCTKGQLVALDIETGDVLWRYQTVPDKVCEKNTTMACDSAADCPDDTRCVDALGAGVTASPITDPTGEFVYMNTVGCYTFPSVGDSDSLFKIKAATGELVWKIRVDPPEQFGFCENDSSIECGTDAVCQALPGVGGLCQQQCVGENSTACRDDSECAQGLCRGFKGAYHDFGFLNGPLLIEAAHGDPDCDTDKLVVSGSKNGTLYAVCEATGKIVWKNEVQPTPVSPGFAGFGLFNGAISYSDGQIFAALNSLIPPRVCDNDHSVPCVSNDVCFGGTCLPEPKHLMAFRATDGMTAWSEEIGRAWAHVRAAGGVVYSGTGTGANAPKEFYAHDAASGARLGTFPLPATTVSRPFVAGDTVYIGYGIPFTGSGGGVRAFSLCGNGDLDDGEQCDDGGAGDCCAPDCTFDVAGTACSDGQFCTAPDTCDGAGGCVAGTETPCVGTACEVCEEDLDRCVDETGAPCVTTTTTTTPATTTTSTTVEPVCSGAGDCDDGNPCTSDTCDPPIGCTHAAQAGECSDGDRCTADTCVGGQCIGAIATSDGVACAYDQLKVFECDGEVLPKKLRKTITKKVKRSRKLFDKATDAGLSDKPEKAAALLGKAAKQLDAIVAQADKAAAAPTKPGKSISEACRDRLRDLVQDRQQVVSGYEF